MGDLSKFFSWDEAACRCGCGMPDEVRARVLAHAHFLDVFRATLDRPVVVTSWYRCRARNAAVGGARDSRHLYGDATDLKVEGFSGLRLRQLAEVLIKLGKIAEGGLGTYEQLPHILHYDSRGTKARWKK